MKRFAIGLIALALMALPAHAQIGFTGSGTQPSATCGDSGHALAWSGTAYTCQAITGGSAGAGGSTTQVQRNNGGAIDGISGFTSDGTAVTAASGDLKLSGSSSGTAILNAPATGGGTLTLPAGTDTIAGIGATQTLSSKTLASPVITGTASGAGTIPNTMLATDPLNSSNATSGTVPAARLPLATTGAFGAVKPDGSSITISGGVISAPGGGSGTVTTLTAGTNVTFSSGATCTTTCTINASGGSVSVTAATPSVVVNPSPGTGTFTVGTTFVINAQTGTTYTVVSGDATKLVTFSNASATAVTLPQATGSFAAGFAFDMENLGAGTVTITPTTSTINGASTLVVTTNKGCSIISDGTNWQVGACTAVAPSAGSGTVTSVGMTVPGGFAISGSPVTVSGTLALTASGTSGGVPYYSSSTTMASSAALTSNLPVIGGGAGTAPSVGTVSGNTTQFVTTTGSQTSGRCVKIDANGNHIQDAAACVSLAGTNNWTAQQSNCITTLTIATTTFTPDGTCNNYKLTLTGSDAIANPSATPVAGTAGIIAVIQDGTGSRTATWGSQYIAAGGVATVALSTGAGAQDYISYYVIDSTHILIASGALNASH